MLVLSDVRESGSKLAHKRCTPVSDATLHRIMLVLFLHIMILITTLVVSRECFLTCSILNNMYHRTTKRCRSQVPKRHSFSWGTLVQIVQVTMTDRRCVATPERSLENSETLARSFAGWNSVKRKVDFSCRHTNRTTDYLLCLLGYLPFPTVETGVEHLKRKPHNDVVVSVAVRRPEMTSLNLPNNR